MYSECNAHAGNLLAGDMLNKTKYEKIMSKVMVVQKDFRRTGLEDRLVKAGGKKPALSCTRWASQRNAADSFLHNLQMMKTVIAACQAEAVIDKATTRPNPHVAQLIFDDRFVESVEETLTLLDPVAELTQKCQRSDFSAGDASLSGVPLQKKLMSSTSPL